MEPISQWGPEDEAEIRVLVADLYKREGVYSVLMSVSKMQKIIIATMTKLNELLEAEEKL
jgi:hypothetical protein